MKKITLLSLMMVCSLGFSQSLPFNFDESDDPTYYFTGFDCAFQLDVDPEDDANPVGKLIGSPNQFYDTAQTLNLAQNIDLSDDANNTITFRIKPVNGTGSGSHLLKFEGGNPVVELPFTTTGTNWQTISLDFGAGLGNYDNMIIFPDFANNASDTYLIDDIAGGTNVDQPADPTAAFPIDFETSEDEFTCYDCAFTIVQDNGDNVGSIIGGGLDYDTAQLRLGTRLDLSDNDNNTITFRIKPVNGTGSGSHLLKFEGGSGPITELPFTTTGTDWQNISLDFGAGLGTYDLVVLFTDFANAAKDTYLIDDLAGGTNVAAVTGPDVAAPTPNAPNSEVFRLYGDTGGYTSNMAYDYTFGTLAGEVDLDESTDVNNALIFDFSFAGWGAGQNSTTDVSAYNYVNFDYWAASNATDFKFFLISKTGSAAQVESTYEIGVDEDIVLQTWTTVSIPISVFTNQVFDINNYFQYKYDVLTQRPGTVYIDNIYFSINEVLSTKSFNISDVAVYPNPSNAEWTIKATQLIKNVEIFDILGKSVRSINTDGMQVSVSTERLNKGVYFARISTEFGETTKKLIKN